jgi:hypothetical protein
MHDATITITGGTIGAGAIYIVATLIAFALIYVAFSVWVILTFDNPPRLIGLILSIAVPIISLGGCWWFAHWLTAL